MVIYVPEHEGKAGFLLIPATNSYLFLYGEFICVQDIFHDIDNKQREIWAKKDNRPVLEIETDQDFFLAEMIFPHKFLKLGLELVRAHLLSHERFTSE